MPGYALIVLPQGLTPSERQAMTDLQGVSPTVQDEAIPDVIDTQLLQESMGGDEAFVEQLQETLRPLCVPSPMCAVSLNPFPVRDSGAMNGHGGTVSPTSIRIGNHSSMAWPMRTSVGSTRTIQVKRNVHPPRARAIPPPPLPSLIATLLPFRYPSPQPAACRPITPAPQLQPRLRS